MKKVFTLIALFSLIIGKSNAQEKLKIFKFQPLPLATSMLAFGVENFNEDRSRSTVINLGIRYKKDNDGGFSYVDPNFDIEPINQFSDWRGLMANIERRFYVPAFRDKGSNMLNQESSQSGVYFSPSLRLDFNQNEFDNSNYEYRYDQITDTQTPILQNNRGKINYLGIMPAINLGVQFTIFQYAYVDLHVGGGIKVQWENEIERLSSRNFYYNNGSIIENLVIREGVQPTGGITFGVKL